MSMQQNRLPIAEKLPDGLPTDARVYQPRYQYHAGSDLKKVTMEFVPDGTIKYRQGVTFAYTATSVPWLDLLDGYVDLATLNWDQPMQGDAIPSINLPPDEPLP